eukprot:10208903-Alexandrium_andersonii.AAC.1
MCCVTVGSARNEGSPLPSFSSGLLVCSVLQSRSRLAARSPGHKCRSRAVLGMLRTSGWS